MIDRRRIYNAPASIAASESSHWITGPQLTVSAMASREVLPATTHTGSGRVASYWLPNVALRIAELTKLADNWDSYSGRRLQADTVASTIRVLREYESAIQSEPAISLTPDGGLACEWETANSMLEINISPESPPTVYYRETLSRREQEGSMDEFPNLEKMLWLVTARM